MSGKVLIAEDDAILSDFLALGLREQGYLVETAASVKAFGEAARHMRSDIWILDRRLPDGDGLVALRHLRAEGRMTPALVLTAMGQLDHRVEGFDAGADDYLTKPFAIAELVVRVRALLRRPPTLSPSVIHFGSLELRLDACRVFSAGEEIPVTANEWRLLRLLTGRPGMAYSRGAFMAEVGISESAGEVAVDHLVSRLRAKLSSGAANTMIKTVRGLGFAWDG